ncbi:hypothetical protein A3L12_02760 [Thermococcus sp. P6]|uniref:hypothetical protein n=1 Tax=Thermococcus sp. P6 TaxID=122420 RepID=UPI000B59B1B5|nr:hypothetical protein [Thermococcus sp. P6]ASJ10291.1 hypothetical protein A3L12_02760 [Thermococcus sp. P6]
MKRQSPVVRTAYYALTGLLSFAAFSVVSAYLRMNGIGLPWTEVVSGGYRVNGLVALLIGGTIGVVIAYAGESLARKRGNPAYYYAGPVVIIVVLAITVLLLYGGACGYCKKVVCSPNPVKECGTNVRLSWTLFEIRCVCAAIVKTLLSLL